MMKALSLPTEAAAKIALRTQQIIAFESGVTDTVDPLAGSYFIEALTDELETAAQLYIDKIDAMGGSVKAIEQDYIQQEIAAAAYQYQNDIESGERRYWLALTNLPNRKKLPKTFLGLMIPSAGNK
jgi:methylmalonyl-CoA mutase N-terminal domain/subunit